MNEIQKRARNLLVAHIGLELKRVAAADEGEPVWLEPHWALAIIAALSAAPQDEYKAAYDEWMNKTEWVHKSATAAELGMHRADVLRMRIEALQVPEGWVLVPVELTQEMRDAWERAPNNLSAEWAYLLAAKPEPPK